MLEKIRRYKLFSILALVAYGIAGIIVMGTEILMDNFMTGKGVAVSCCAMFIVGMVLQLMQLLCSVANGCDLFGEKTYNLTKEESEELLKYIDETFKEEE